MTHVNDVDYVLENLESTDEATRLLWVDVETTGLDPNSDSILEVGFVPTDFEGNVSSEPFVAFIDNGTFTPLDALGQTMKQVGDPGYLDFVTEMHQDSGLWQAYSKGTHHIRLANAWDEFIGEVLDRGVDPKKLMLAGSSVGFDKSFMQAEGLVTQLEDINYRVLDISSIKELCAEFNPDLYARLPEVWDQEKKHRPLQDIVDSIKEYRFYLQEFLMIPGLHD